MDLHHRNGRKSSHRRYNEAWRALYGSDVCLDIEPVPLTEAEEQRKFIKWIRSVPELHGCVVKIHNEGKRSPVAANNAKGLGLLPGAADLFIAIPSQAWHGLWIEFKQNRRYIPSEMNTEHWQRQEAFMLHMQAAGYAAEVAYGCEHAVRIVKAYLAGKGA